MRSIKVLFSALHYAIIWIYFPLASKKIHFRNGNLRFSSHEICLSQQFFRCSWQHIISCSHAKLILMIQFPLWKADFLQHKKFHLIRYTNANFSRLTLWISCINQWWKNIEKSNFIKFYELSNKTYSCLNDFIRKAFRVRERKVWVWKIQRFKLIYWYQNFPQGIKKTRSGTKNKEINPQLRLIIAKTCRLLEPFRKVHSTENYSISHESIKTA